MTTESDNEVIGVKVPGGQIVQMAPATIDDYYKITLYRDGRTVGALDFSSGKLDFTGDATESARVFMEALSGFFDQAVKRAADSRWRKVSEELPKDGQRVLSWTRWKDDEGYQTEVTVYSGETGRFEGVEGRTQWSATHWMPLPVPPDEEA